MSNPLKILLLEDMKADQELIKRQVLKFAPKSIFTIADNKESFFQKVEWYHPDLVMADYALPDFTGLDALLYFKENLPEVPFVFVTGELNNEEKVAETILSGADGYILKNNLHKIPEVIERVIIQKQTISKKRAALEEKIKRHQLHLQKAHQLLTNSQSFDNKQEIISILEKLSNSSLAEVINLT